MSAGPSTVQHVIVLDSADPNADALDMMRMFPKFILEKSTESESVAVLDSVALLVASSNELASPGGILLLLVTRDCDGTNKQPSSCHTRQTLVLSNDEIGTAVEICSTTGATVTVCETLSFVPSPGSTRSFTYAIICLGGGSSVLLAPPDMLSSNQGRLAVTKFVTGAAPQELRNHFLTGCDDADKKIPPIDSFTDIPVTTDSSATNELPAISGNSNGSAIMEGELEQTNHNIPKFPSLSVSIMQKNGQMKSNFPLNSQVSVPVDTDLFVGSAIFILRPPYPETDRFYNEMIFSKKKRRLILQLQGKFKRVPKGTVFAGCEVSEQMKLGLVSKGLCSLLLKLMISFQQNMHHSFGDKHNTEQAHIVFPAWQFFASIIATKPGDTPPPISQPFVESKESVNARKTSSSNGIWNAEDTYSMTFHTMYVDLPTWRLVQLPVTRDLDLRTFWGKSLLSIVMYENISLSGETRHIQDTNKYFFSIQMKFLGDQGVSSDDEMSTEHEDIVRWDNARPLAPSGDSFVNAALVRRDQQKSPNFVASGDGSKEDSFYDARTTRHGSTGMCIEDDAIYFDAKQQQPRRYMSDPEVLQPGKAFIIDMICPAWIEIRSPSGKDATVYAFNIGQKKGSKTVYRTASQFTSCFDTAHATRLVEASCSPRMSSSERNRRIMGRTLAQAIASANKGNLQIFMDQKTVLEATFLQKPASLLSSTKTKGSLCVSNVARALSEHHWVEEFAKLTTRRISFYQQQTNKPTFRIPIENIVSVQKLSASESPHFPHYHFMTIETLGRTVYLMFLSESERDNWVDVLVKLTSPACCIESPPPSPSSVGSRGSCVTGNSPDVLLSVDDPTEEFLHKSSLWSCKQRRILNCRRFSFRGSDKRPDPSVLVVDALRRALDPIETSEDMKIRAFLDSASALKDADVNQLSEVEKLAFFLNLYHVMIMHAFLVIGTPDSTFKWLTYFNIISYQCSDDIFSLTELEHCIIRSAMNYPSQFVSKFILPKSRYSFCLTKADYRINFALNCGSLSNPGRVSIFTADSIDEELDYATKSFLAHSVRVTPKSKTGSGVILTLPRVIQWFAGDFGNGSTLDALRLIKKFLNDDDQQLLLKGNITVKHLAFVFECRPLVLDYVLPHQ